MNLIHLGDAVNYGATKRLEVEVMQGFASARLTLSEDSKRVTHMDIGIVELRTLRNLIDAAIASIDHRLLTESIIVAREDNQS